jgi:hypothetical protein
MLFAIIAVDPFMGVLHHFDQFGDLCGLGDGEDLEYILQRLPRDPKLWGSWER